MLTKYFDTWKVKINNTKTEEITFTRKIKYTKIFTNLNINGHKIKPAKTVKYLGVHMQVEL